MEECGRDSIMEIVIREDYGDNRLREKEKDLLAEFVRTKDIKI